MARNVLVFLPKQLDIGKAGYIKGFVQEFPDCQAFYVTSYKLFNSHCSNCLGFISRKNNSRNSNNFFLQLNYANNILINKVINSDSVVQIIYDYYDFKQSHLVDLKGKYGRHFQVLSDKLQKGNENSQNGRKSIWKLIFCIIIFIMNNILWLLSKSKHLCMCCATFQHFTEIVMSTKVLFQEICDKKINPILYNHLSAKIIDMILGLLALKFFIKHESQIVEIIQILIHGIISNLRDLLLYLMGSPIGLKLNHAFNMSLGQFFFYHISLWKIFLLSIGPIFTTYFRYFVLSGVFGISLQFAMISDVISILTFHIYCIYVYAARLFNLQLKCLISLWRLFIGKKYNPLRERVDSCQYSPNQLFVGTLVFTVLLFLLPTTIMYYTVFCMFRLVIISVDGMLLNSIYLLKSIPLYIVVLWIKRSPSLAGSLHIDWKNCHEEFGARIEVKLKILPLMQCIRPCMPIKSKHCRPLRVILRCVITGALL